MDRLGPIAEAEGAVVALGVNVDDLARPPPGPAGRHASAAPCSRSSRPGFTKADGPGAWPGTSACRCGTSRPRPAWPPGCPTGRRSPSAPSPRWPRPKEALRPSGSAELRVRHYGDLARLELDAGRAGPRPSPGGTEVVAAVRAAGYRYVTLDLEGLRSGNLNAIGHIEQSRPAPGRRHRAALPRWVVRSVSSESCWPGAGECPGGRRRGRRLSRRPGRDGRRHPGDCSSADIDEQASTPSPCCGQPFGTRPGATGGGRSTGRAGPLRDRRVPRRRL